MTVRFNLRESKSQNFPGASLQTPHIIKFHKIYISLHSKDTYSYVSYVWPHISALCPMSSFDRPEIKFTMKPLLLTPRNSTQSSAKCKVESDQPTAF